MSLVFRSFCTAKFVPRRVSTHFDRGDSWISNGTSRAMRQFGFLELWTEHSELESPNSDGLAIKETTKSSQIRFFLSFSTLLSYLEKNRSIRKTTDWLIVFKQRYVTFLHEKCIFNSFAIAFLLLMIRGMLLRRKMIRVKISTRGECTETDTKPSANDGSKLARAKNDTKSFLWCKRDEQVTYMIKDYSRGNAGTSG